MENVNVTGVFNAGYKSTPETYRSISATLVRCRILERIVRAEVIQYLTTNHFLSEFQHGFRRGYSCPTQLLKFIGQR